MSDVPNQEFLQRLQIAQDSYFLWRNKRQEAIRIVPEAKAKLEKTRNDCNIAVVAGASASLLGGGLSIAGAICLIFPLAWVPGIVLLATGAGLSGTGGVTAGGSKAADHIISKSVYKDAIRILQEDLDLWKKFQEACEQLDDWSQFISEIKLPTPFNKIEKTEDGKPVDAVKEVASSLGKIGSEGFQTTMNVIKIAKSSKALEALNTANGLSKITSNIVSASDDAAAIGAQTGAAVLRGTKIAAVSTSVISGILMLGDIYVIFNLGRQIRVYNKNLRERKYDCTEDLNEAAKLLESVDHNSPGEDDTRSTIEKFKHEWTRDYVSERAKKLEKWLAKLRIHLGFVDDLELFPSQEDNDKLHVPSCKLG